jgi:NAD(P)-dependent dehydrogenase (short-subunit alcohol dehydrogenase family)
MADENVLGLAGRPALVIGGGDGIGRESALLLARAGADVALADMVQEKAEAVQKECEALGVKAVALSGDVTDQSQAERIVAEAADFHGGLEVLINMVGTAAWGDLFELSDEDWDLDLTRNLRHHIYVGRAAARRMIDRGRGGRMAFVASVSGLYGAPNHAAYGVAKAGLMSLTRSMAQEWAPHGIRVNAVAPDIIATPRVVAAWKASGQDVNGSIGYERAPLARFGTPFEIAGPLVFLVSDLSSFMTGNTLVSDGGAINAFPMGGPPKVMGKQTESPVTR